MKTKKRLLSILLNFTLVLGLMLGMSLTTLADTADAIKAVSDPDALYGPTKIINGDFESAMMDSNKNGRYNGTNSGWGTTDNAFEISDNIGTYGLKDHTGKFAEMNANNVATLYQDLSTTGGDIMVWTLQHAARKDKTDQQSMAVRIGASDGNYPNGTGSSINVHISTDTLAEFTASGVKNPDGKSLGFSASDGDLSALTLVSTGSQNEWKTARGVYIIPEGQTVTRFAFVSTNPDLGSYGNMLDNITFATLLGNAKAAESENGDVVLSGYWGDTDSSKTLKVRIGDTVHSIDMSDVVGKNFKIIIPKSTIGSATSVTVYHQDYPDAAKTILITAAPTIIKDPKDLSLLYGYRSDNVVDVSATVASGHSLSYQWYKNTSNANDGGTAVDGATSASYAIPTGKNAGTTEYYYCVVASSREGSSVKASVVSKAAKVTVGKANAVAAIVTANNRTYDETEKPLVTVDDSTLVGGTMKYAIGNDSINEPEASSYADALPNGTNAGVYYVWCKAVGNENYNDSEAKPVTVTVGNANAVAASVTPNNRIFDGTEKPLVTIAGEPTGGTMQYALGTATESTEPYTASIPAKTNAGTYYVWYYVKGDSNHTDSEPVCIMVKIAGAAYTVTDGEHTINDGKDTSVTVKREPDDSKTYDLYTGAQMDGKALPEGSHTTAKGSLVMTLKAAYLDTLSVGDHKLTIAFQDGSATATIRIKDAEPTPPPAPTAAPTATPKPVPKTGDGSNPALWLSLAVAGLILIAGTVILWNRKKSCGK